MCSVARSAMCSISMILCVCKCGGSVACGALCVLCMMLPVVLCVALQLVLYV